VVLVPREVAETDPRCAERWAKRGSLGPNATSVATVIAVIWRLMVSSPAFLRV
jgi:hypothetical protein